MTKKKPGKPPKRGRPRKVDLPGKPSGAVKHHLTPRLRIAIEAMAERNKSIKEAAAEAGLTESAVNKGLLRPVIREYFLECLKPLRVVAKGQALHALIAEMKGSNAAARVAAARTLLEEDAKVPIASGMPQQPGFSILIVDGRAPVGQALPTNGHAAPMLTAQAVEEGSCA